MGGTSTDVALLQGGLCRMASEAVVHGYPIKAPMLDIHTVGAGGGSIAFVDTGGLLKVGPRSAGAHPGPVCYGKGSTEPTVTDANVVLQTLNPTHLLGGRMAIDQGIGETVDRGPAEQLGLDVMATAQGILSVVAANMARAIRVISVQRGHDPRDYTLAAFGGAGPLHAARLARELDIGRILVPRNPGILCAMGLLLTDCAPTSPPRACRPWARPRCLRWRPPLQPCTRRPSSGSRPRTYRPASAASAAPWTCATPGRTTSCRCRSRTGRSRWRRSTCWRTASPKRISAFTALSPKASPCSSSPFASRPRGWVRKAAFKPRPELGADASGAIIGRREVWLPEAGGFVACPVYDRDRLDAGNRIFGPAIVEQMDATTVVLPGMVARVEPYLNLILETAA